MIAGRWVSVVTSAGSWRNWIASWRTGLAFERCCGFGLSPCVDVPGEVVAVLDEELAQLGVVDEPAWVGDLVPSRETVPTLVSRPS
jgi:hypothetical protein